MSASPPPQRPAAPLVAQRRLENAGAERGTPNCTADAPRRTAAAPVVMALAALDRVNHDRRVELLSGALTGLFR